MKPLRALVRIALAVIGAVSALAAAELAPSAAERVTHLQAEIARHDELYFRQAAPEISDAAYDALKRELRSLLERHPELAQADRPARAALGDDRTGRFPTAPHLRPMLGLEKSYTEAELRRFLSRVRRAAGDAPLAFVVEPKYDGLAISLVYENGELRRAVTRGNGAEGDVVTENLLLCAEVPRRLASSAHGGVPRVVEIRGEVYLTHAEFERLNAARLAAGEPVHAHPRNLAVGTLKSSDVAAVRARRLSLVCYGWGAWEPVAAAPASQREALARLQAWGFAVPPAQIAPSPEAVWQLVRAFDRARVQFPAPLDGAVVKVDDAALRARLGSTGEGARGEIAHKFEPERVETRLKAITWQVGRTGVLTPVAELEPVTIGGTLVSRASLQNRREIDRRDYRVGDLVRVEKAGEIIPQLAGVNLAARAPEALRLAVPSACPSCGAALVVEEVAVRCPNRSCVAQVRRRLEHFVGAAALDLNGFGPTVVAALVNTAGVREPHELYRLQPEDWRRVAGGRAQMAERLAAEVERSRRAELWRFVLGLGLPGVGRSTARRLAEEFADLADLREAPRKRLIRAGLTGDGATELEAELKRPEVRAAFDGLIAAGVEPAR